MIGRIGVMLDSGAPTIYNQLSRKGLDSSSGIMGSYLKDRKHDDFGYVDTDEFKVYRDAYVEFVKKHGSKIDTVVNLDIINNAKLSYEMVKFLEAEGLNPIPVYHFGSDVEYLKKYLEEGYDYIGIGGIVPNPPSVIIPALDTIWSQLLCDSRGMPVVKVHGFAVTSPKIATRWPWYSVDSTSWVKFGKYGSVLIPKKDRGEWNYKESPRAITLSIRSPQKRDANRKHILALPEEERLEIRQYIDSKGFVYGKSEIKKVGSGYKCEENEFFVSSDREEVEVVVELGISNSHFQRDILNGIFYLEMERSVPPWPWAFKSKSKRGFIL